MEEPEGELLDTECDSSEDPECALEENETPDKAHTVKPQTGNMGKDKTGINSTPALSASTQKGNLTPSKDGNSIPKSKIETSDTDNSGTPTINENDLSAEDADLQEIINELENELGSEEVVSDEIPSAEGDEFSMDSDDEEIEGLDLEDDSAEEGFDHESAESPEFEAGEQEEENLYPNTLNSEMNRFDYTSDDKVSPSPRVDKSNDLENSMGRNSLISRSDLVPKTLANPFAIKSSIRMGLYPFLGT
jgi:hypothetical protein